MKVIDVRIAVMEIADIMAYEANMENGGAGHHFTKDEFMDVAEAMLENVPIIEVEPVRRGHWEVIDREEPRSYGCSRCKCISFWETSYCSRCGAKMENDDE